MDDLHASSQLESSAESNSLKASGKHRPHQPCISYDVRDKWILYRLFYHFIAHLNLTIRRRRESVDDTKSFARNNIVTKLKQKS